MLQELAELGMDIARALGVKAQEPEASPDIALQFARVAKAVRQTLALQVSIEEGLLAEAAKQAALAAATAPPPPVVRTRAETGKERLREVFDLLADGEEPEEMGSYELRHVLHEWRSDLDETESFADLPYETIIARICADLGLSPDWGRDSLEAYLSDGPPYMCEKARRRAAGTPLPEPVLIVNSS